MGSSERTGVGTRAVVGAVGAGLLVIATISTVRGHQPASMSATTAGSPRPTLESAAPSTSGRVDDPNTPLGPSDGVLAVGTTVFDRGSPAITNLDPALLRALRDAARDGVAQGVELVVNSGWRSARYQEQLLRDAIAKYGSAKNAARWVGTPETSAHVAGQAVDIGPAKAETWLSRFGRRYGLCQIYRNEPWHYELRPAAVNGGCPRMYADPSRDPRMQP